MKTADLIKNCIPFSGLSSTALTDLSQIAEYQTCTKGDVLFTDGDEATALFLLVEGAIDLVKIAPTGREQFVRSVKCGEMFAEAVMFAGEAYPATAIARQNSRLITISKKRFITFVRAHPDASLAIMGVMAKLLRHLNTLLADLSLGQVSNRLAAFLIAKSRERRKIEFSLGITKRELALRLGTIPATLSRNLRKLKEEGIIDVRGDFVTIKKFKALESLAKSNGA